MRAKEAFSSVTWEKEQLPKIFNVNHRKILKLPKFFILRGFRVAAGVRVVRSPVFLVESELIIQVSRSLSLGFQLRFQCHHIVKNVHEFFVESQKILKCIDY